MQIQSHDPRFGSDRNPTIERLAVELLNQLLAGGAIIEGGERLNLDALSRLPLTIPGSSVAGSPQQIVWPDRTGQVFVFGPVELDPKFRVVTKRGAPVKLTYMEYELLLALAQREGAPVPKLVIRREVWGDTITLDSRSIDQHIHELRHKLEDTPSTPAYVRTVVKVGYSLKGEWLAKG
jgi:DNA-binding winged helix-turn-helix (wHTH) protein